MSREHKLHGSVKADIQVLVASTVCSSVISGCKVGCFRGHLNIHTWRTKIKERSQPTVPLEFKYKLKNISLRISFKMSLRTFYIVKSSISNVLISTMFTTIFPDLKDGISF